MKPRDNKYILKGGYKKGKIEKGFQAEIMDRLELEGYETFHPADIGYAEKFLDLHFVTPNGELGWIEFKKIEKDTFNLNQFEDSQVILLPELERRNPDIARVFIYSVKHNDYKIFKFSELWNNANEKRGIKIFTNK